MKNMIAVRVDCIGGPETLATASVPRPEPGPNQALVRIAYSGVNYVDVMRRADVWRHAGDPPPTLPFGLGAEAAGVVAAFGANVTGMTPGQRVGLIGHNIDTYAEYAVVAADELMPLPDDIDDRTAAASLAAGLLSQVMLSEVGPVAGRSIVVSGASGGVGSFLLQWAAALGAHAIATATSEAKAAAAARLGAEACVQSSEPDLAQAIRRENDGRGVDIVFDAVGGTLFPKLLDALDTRGTIVPYGIAGGKQPALEVLSLIDRSRRLLGIALFDFLRNPAERIERGNAVFEALRSGAVKPNIDSVFRLDEAAAAHRRFEARECVGKILLDARSAKDA